jgi:hypothetical protein
MKLPQIVIAGAAVAALSACSSAASSVAPPPASSAPGVTAAAAPTLSPPATVASLAPLTLGNFPSTTDGTLARNVCQAWAGLRVAYASNVVNDSPYQLNQWFNGPAWATPNAEMEQLGDDPAFIHLESDYGAATVGDVASAANAANLDRACENAD